MTTLRPKKRRRRSPRPASRRSEDQHFSGTLQEIIREVIPQEDHRRAEVMSDHWRRAASQRHDVNSFRTWNLGGDTISQRKAQAFLEALSNDEGLAAETQRICARLSKDYAWDMRQALRFLLTGNAPMLDPLEVDGFRMVNGKWGNSARVTLSFDLYTSPRTIMRAITRLRRLAGQVAKRPIEEKLIRLAEIVSESMFDPELQSQRDCMRQWNNDYPDWAYDDERHFARDCKRARRIVLFMNIAPPELGPGEEYPGAF